MKKNLRIAYFINQYPKISLSFFRREILALERQGTEVQCITLRGWQEELVDTEGLQEQKQTNYVLKNGISVDRSWPFHLIYLAEAAKLIELFKKSCS